MKEITQIIRFSFVLVTLSSFPISVSSSHPLKGQVLQNFFCRSMWDNFDKGFVALNDYVYRVPTWVAQFTP